MQLFYVCFGVGVVYTIISFLMGQLFDFFDFDGSFEIGSNISPMKPAVIAVFVTVFGGMGIILMRRNIDFIYSIGFSFFTAFVMSYILYRLIIQLYKSQNTSAVEIQKLIGYKAKVTLAIRQGGYGKITYIVNGNTYNSPAKAENGGYIEAGKEVEIVYIDKNTYFVKNNEEGNLCHHPIQ